MGLGNDARGIDLARPGDATYNFTLLAKPWAGQDSTRRNHVIHKTRHHQGHRAYRCQQRHRRGHHIYIGAWCLDQIIDLQDELRAEGCHVEAVQLDVTHLEDLQVIVTNITNAIQPDGQAYLTEHGRKATIGLATRPEEIAQVVFLASDQASYIVGAVVMADGGMSVAIQ
ncbi:SDR family oxidoreductase [Acinetobacter baumannii]|nr:SDR family oxidoreductase [Acinetobacter baumannii]EKT9124854.1 SDR family oxidoreductase [Acinetobacter baumannii]EKT9271832.1 SDR family oxidoreductase [Acinetobacter baumannii]EKT9313684.1 SDR family oxidoreductase [Acinetobacter baumannii]EKU0109400.1 SDR family oxidoreductase [Acinetobacter baumannii]